MLSVIRNIYTWLLRLTHVAFICVDVLEQVGGSYEIVDYCVLKRGRDRFEWEGRSVSVTDEAMSYCFQDGWRWRVIVLSYMSAKEGLLRFVPLSVPMMINRWTKEREKLDAWNKENGTSYTTDMIEHGTLEGRDLTSGFLGREDVKYWKRMAMIAFAMVLIMAVALAVVPQFTTHVECVEPATINGTAHVVVCPTVVSSHTTNSTSSTGGIGQVQPIIRVRLVG